MGVENIALGSDYPFPLGESLPGSMIEESNMKLSTKENLLFKNALDWLDLPHDNFL